MLHSAIYCVREFWSSNSSFGRSVLVISVEPAQAKTELSSLSD